VDPPTEEPTLPDHRPPAILLGGLHNALSLIRSLGRQGVEVSLLADSSRAPGRSRLCAGFMQPASDTQASWLEWLLSRPARDAVLLPCSDNGLDLVARHRAELVDHGYRPFEANDEVLLTMLDKQATYERARALGIDCPRTILLSDESLERVAGEIGFPCALKPLHAHVFGRHFRKKLVVIPDRAELDRVHGITSSLGLEMLATEIIPGPESSFCSYYTYIDADGSPLLHFTKRKTRQYPVRFGTGSYHHTLWDEEVAETGLRFLQGMGIRGLGNVEFKRDERTGALRLIEGNPRFTAATEILRLSGLDLAGFVYARLAGIPGPPVDGFRDNVYLWLPIEDTMAFLSLRKSGDITFREWIDSLRGREQHLPLWDWRDPLPSIASLGEMSVRFGRKLRQRRSGVRDAI
jgi:D-aspartate ligase